MAKRFNLTMEHSIRDLLMEKWEDRKEEIKAKILEVAADKCPLSIPDFFNEVSKTFVTDIDEVYGQKNPPEQLKRRCVSELIFDGRLNLSTNGKLIISLPEK
jgi:hypothetical protein